MQEGFGGDGKAVVLISSNPLRLGRRIFSAQDRHANGISQAPCNVVAASGRLPAVGQQLVDAGLRVSLDTPTVSFYPFLSLVPVSPPDFSFLLSRLLRSAPSLRAARPEHTAGPEGPHASLRLSRRLPAAPVLLTTRLVFIQSARTMQTEEQRSREVRRATARCNDEARKQRRYAK